jgi:hypothetical protein
LFQNLFRGRVGERCRRILENPFDEFFEKGFITRGAGEVAGVGHGVREIPTVLFESRFEAGPTALPGLGVSIPGSGVLDRELAEWGRYYSESAGEAMEQLAEWAPKLFYWGILLFVGALIIRAGLAYRDLIEGLLNLGG